MSETPPIIVIGWACIAVAVGWAQGPTALAAFGVALFALYVVYSVWTGR